MPWAMAKLEASSFAPMTLRPVETRSWVLFKLSLVTFRLRNATIAAMLVLTELAMSSASFGGSDDRVSAGTMPADRAKPPLQEQPTCQAL